VATCCDVTELEEVDASARVSVEPLTATSLLSDLTLDLIVIIVGSLTTHKAKTVIAQNCLSRK